MGGVVRCRVGTDCSEITGAQWRIGLGLRLARAEIVDPISLSPNYTVRALGRSLAAREESKQRLEISGKLFLTEQRNLRVLAHMT
jgi:hypothetical protein